SKPRAEQTHEAAHDRQQYTFGKQLPHDARPPRPDGRTDRQFLPPIGRSRQQQIGEVGAGDQQHQRDHAPENKKGEPKILNQLIAQRRERNVARRGEVTRDLVKLSLGALDDLPRLESSHHHEIVSAGATRVSRLKSQRNQQIGRWKEVKLRRQNPDDSVAPFIERHCLPDNLRVLTKAVSPEAMADQYDLLVTGLKLFGCERATRLWRDAEQGQQLAGNPLPSQLLRRDATCNGEITRHGSRQMVQRPMMLAPP